MTTSEPTPNHTFVKLLKGGFLTVALIRNAPDVPEQFISVKLIRFALSLYPIVFIVYGHYPAKFMTEHSLSNRRLDLHLGHGSVRLEGVAAGARHRALDILGMDTLLHGRTPYWSGAGYRSAHKASWFPTKTTNSAMVPRRRASHKRFTVFSERHDSDPSKHISTVPSTGKMPSPGPEKGPGDVRPTAGTAFPLNVFG